MSLIFKVLRYQKFVDAFIDFPKPLAALVNGPAIGIGCTHLGVINYIVTKIVLNAFSYSDRLSTLLICQNHSHLKKIWLVGFNFDVCGKLKQDHNSATMKTTIYLNNDIIKYAVCINLVKKYFLVLIYLNSHNSRKYIFPWLTVFF